jgi:hypothetical protein
MTAQAHDRLADLADTVLVRPVDVIALRRTAVRRTYRARAAAALVTAAAVVAAVTVVGTVAGSRTDSPVADDLSQRTAVVPSEQRLREVLAAADPPVGVGDVRFCCQGPIRRPDSKNLGTEPYTTLPFGRDDRVSVYPELVMLPSPGEDLQVNWSVVNPPMTDDEAADLARGVVPPDPDPAPVPVSHRLVNDTADGIRSVVYAYAFADEDRLSAAAWSADGGYVRLSAPGGAADTARAEWMNGIARALITPRPAADASEPAAPADTTPRAFRALHVGQVDGGAFGGTTAVFGRPTATAGKRITDQAGTASYVVVAFPPPAMEGSCVGRAVLRLDARGGNGTGPLNAYVAAHTSAARGQNPPPPGRASDLLDNRPAAQGEQTGRTWMFDATEMVRLVADGAAFPSRGRTLPTGAPVVLVVRPPDAAAGDYSVVFDATSAVLDITAAPGCD